MYFTSPIKAGTKNFNVYLASEQVKNQNPNILDLYNIRVKRNSQNAHLSTSSGNNNNITPSSEDINTKLYSREEDGVDLKLFYGVIKNYLTHYGSCKHLLPIV